MASQKDCENLMIIDTDVGSDDAMAMILALGSPNWKILAITTVFGNIAVDKANEGALRILQLCDRPEIPVYKGCSGALLYPTESDNYHGPDGMGGYSHLFPLPQKVVETKEHAVNALVRLAREFPRKISLVTLGPLTNVAMAQRLDPNFSSNLKDIMIMGGNILGKGNVKRCSEFNFDCDPEAAEIVLREFKNDIQITSWETSQDHLQPWEWYDKWISLDTKKSKFAAKATEHPVSSCRYKTKRAGYHCCDLLAMTAKIYPHLVTKKEKRHVEIEIYGKTTRGMMVVEWRNHQDVTPNAELILEMNLQGVQDLWWKMLLD